MRKLKTTAKHKMLQAIIWGLADYANEHFAGEEALMETSGLDLKHISTHKEALNQFFEEDEKISPLMLKMAKLQKSVCCLSIGRIG